MAEQAGFLQVKAFGDFVIANAAAERVIESDRNRLTLMIGRHLRPLCEAIAPNIRVIELETVESGVPSIFDVHKNGRLAAAKSAFWVRKAVANSSVSRQTTLILDRLGWRERFICAGRPAIRMPADVPNIYEGYDRLLTGLGFELKPLVAMAAGDRRRAGIFPGSRIAAKNLPVTLVTDLLAEARRRGVPATLFLLDGERPDLEASGLPHVVVPRSFTALRDAIASTDAVISADSLPAHLAESMSIDMFVLTPRANEFWMPHSAFRNRRWCLFDDPQRLDLVGALLSPRSV